MSNLADVIERFILHKLSREEDDIVILQRNEIAEEIACAPSQVSYVLSTRFTVARGFIVESRRGSGGFIRIARIPLWDLVYADVAKRMDADTTLEEMEDIISHLGHHGLLDRREAALIDTFCQLIYEHVAPSERAIILRSLFLRLGE